MAYSPLNLFTYLYPFFFLSFSLQLCFSSGLAKCPKPRFFLSSVSILSAYVFPPFCFRVRFFLVSTSVLRDFGATVVYPCHNSPSEGTASPRKRVLHLLSSYSKKKNLLKNGDPFVKYVVTIDHLLWFVLLAASFCCDSSVCVFFSLFFRQSTLYNLHNLFDCLYFFAMCINFLFSPFFKTLNTQFFCILSESFVRNRFEGLILLY